MAGLQHIFHSIGHRSQLSSRVQSSRQDAQAKEYLHSPGRPMYPRYRKLLIGDSIIVNLENISNISVVVHRGKDLRFFKKYVRSNASWIRQFNLTVVHVGTNNIEKFSASESVEFFKCLVKEFSTCHPQWPHRYIPHTPHAKR